jgi:hypothetical protein
VWLSVCGNYIFSPTPTAINRDKIGDFSAFLYDGMTKYFQMTSNKQQGN